MNLSELSETLALEAMKKRIKVKLQRAILHYEEACVEADKRKDTLDAAAWCLENSVDDDELDASFRAHWQAQVSEGQGFTNEMNLGILDRLRGLNGLEQLMAKDVLSEMIDNFKPKSPKKIQKPAQHRTPLGKAKGPFDKGPAKPKRRIWRKCEQKSPIPSSLLPASAAAPLSPIHDISNSSPLMFAENGSTLTIFALFAVGCLNRFFVVPKLSVKSTNPNIFACAELMDYHLIRTISTQAIQEHYTKIEHQIDLWNAACASKHCQLALSCPNGILIARRNGEQVLQFSIAPQPTKCDLTVWLNSTDLYLEGPPSQLSKIL
jgi:hypothetical protein